MKPLEELERAAVSAGCLAVCGEPMSRHTTFRVGGPADLFVTVMNAEALSLVLKKAAELSVPIMMIGNGSNLLAGDKGIRGCVVLLSGEFTQVRRISDTEIRCGAGVSLAGACNAAKKYTLSGLEFAWGIPGSVGGAVYMNAGAYGGEMRQAVSSVRCMYPDGTIGEIRGGELDFGYRHSVFMENGAVITDVTFSLKPGNRDVIALAMEDFYNRRKEKQPLNKPSAGSVFKRPEGYFAGSLIERCGLKGASVGGAAVSEKHAGFIINTGGATCADVLGLIGKIQETVQKETGVLLECEIRMVGE